MKNIGGRVAFKIKVWIEDKVKKSKSGVSMKNAPLTALSEHKLPTYGKMNQ